MYYIHDVKLNGGVLKIETLYNAATYGRVQKEGCVKHPHAQLLLDGDDDDGDEAEQKFL